MAAADSSDCTICTVAIGTVAHLVTAAIFYSGLLRVPHIRALCTDKGVKEPSAIREHYTIPVTGTLVCGVSAWIQCFLLVALQQIPKATWTSIGIPECIFCSNDATTLCFWLTLSSLIWAVSMTSMLPCYIMAHRPPTLVFVHTFAALAALLVAAFAMWAVKFGYPTAA